MILGLLFAASLCQQPAEDLSRALAAEAKRIEIMAKVAPSVCSVMKIESQGGGSGVIFSEFGHVLTNYHVVGDAEVKRIQVGLPSGELHMATVLGIDPGSDLAVLLLDPPEGNPPWPHSSLGDSNDLQVGETVFAMGNPFLLATDFKPTVTWGIVSGLHRYQPGGDNRSIVYPDCIQVDAAVNPGNSGGPLFNMQGELVGINGRISVRNRGRINVGVGFAIPSHQIANFLPDLMAGKHAEHGTLDANTWMMPADDGSGRRAIIVQSLFEDSLIANFGVELGDEITSFDGKVLRKANELAALVGILPAGTLVRIGFRNKRMGGGYDPEKIFEIALPTLDTGSSLDPNRLASARHRTIGAGYILRHLVKKPGIEAAKFMEALEAVPWLSPDTSLQELCKGSRLAGGLMIDGQAAYRIELPETGGRQVFLYVDGRFAGCSYHDQALEAQLELRVNGNHSRIFHGGVPLQNDNRAKRDQPARSPKAKPETVLRDIIAKSLPSLVKIQGASGLANVIPYATGIIVSTQGHILTIDQVTLQKGQTRVVLNDGSIHQAELLPPDPNLGIRLLKIPAVSITGISPLVPASSVPAHGSLVVSIGNCFRLAEFSEKLSATFGLVVATTDAGLRYRLQKTDYDADLIITDAPNNPGHLGGALITLGSEWIGINTRVVISTETNTQISAAIPARDLHTYLDRMIHGQGIGEPGADSIEDARPSIEHGIVLFDRGGRHSPPAYIERIRKNSPASRIGLRPDDLIMRIDHYPVRTCEEFNRIIGRFDVADILDLTIKRRGKILRRKLTLEIKR